ncbi:MAG TPA: hypothetical protein VGG20_13975 [Thermoanaerobaculia bacterium]|jgi:hypothetical protein
MDNNSYADMFRNWEKLLNSSNENAALLPGFEPFRDALAASLANTKALKDSQESFEGNRQAMTQQVQQAVVDGWKVARKLRALVKAHLGPNSEHLVQFDIQPIRKRPRKAKPAVTPPPAVETPQTHVESK